jgi:phage repressor protein C with HTH and peptisase S24 domain
VAATPKKKKARMLKINFYSDPASAGTGNFLDETVPDEIWVKETDHAERADYVIGVSGDSMEPTFHNGSRVFVEHTDDIRIGEIGIFSVNGEVYIKELGDECLISHTDKYKPITFGAADSVYCCGRVVGIVEQ